MTSVVLVLHNSADGLDACLRSLPANVEVVVVDNASTDGGLAVVVAARPDARIVLTGTNRGFGAGCNRGAREATGDVVIFLNPDTLVHSSALETLAAAVRAQPASIFGPALLDDDGALRVNVRRRSHPWHEVSELLPAARRWVPAALSRDVPADAAVYRQGGAVDYLQGACLAISRATFLAVGGFDEAFFLYGEEEDLCDRVRAAGGACLYLPCAEVAHQGETSSAKTGTFATFQLYRSRVLLYRKRAQARGLAASVVIAASVRATAAVAVLGRGAGHDEGWRRAALAGLRDGRTASLGG